MNAVSDTNIQDNILNIGRRRERAIYYRKDGTPTNPLPADTYSQLYYIKKGFTLEAKGKEVVISGIRCPYCGFEPKNALALRTHLNKHVGDISEDKEEIK